MKLNNIKILFTLFLFFTISCSNPENESEIKTINLLEL